MLPAQDIIIIRHAERYGNEITQEGEEQAKELGKFFASGFLNNNPQWIALFDCDSSRVRQTMQAIIQWMGLSPDCLVHTLPLDGKYDEVSKHEIWKSGRIIRWVSAEIWTILIVTNWQYIQKLADNLWKYWWISYQESDQIKSRDNHLSYLEYIHWEQKLAWDIPNKFLKIMWDNFGKTISLQKLAEEWEEKIRFEELDLKNYMWEKAWYFDIRLIQRESFRETTGISVDSNRIITFFPKIEPRNDDAVAIMPTQEEFTAELIRASSYLWDWKIPFINPIQWLKYRIGYHEDLFR